MILCAGFTGLTLLTALEWPVSEVNPVSFFGQRSDGIIERGIKFEKADSVRSAGYGKVLLTLEQNSNMSGFPGTLGNAVIIAHDDGLITIYGNLANLDQLSERVQIESQEILASPGNSGWGKPQNVFFQVVDSLKKTVLNPLLLLPSLKDTHGPSIREVIVLSSNNQISVLGSVKFVRQGKYRIYADITDTIDKSASMLSPFRISVLVNGKEYLTIPFELMQENQGRLFLSSAEYYWETLYADPARMYLGDLSLTRGRSDISIIARDMAGNERSVLFGIQVE